MNRDSHYAKQAQVGTLALALVTTVSFHLILEDKKSARFLTSTLRANDMTLPISLPPPHDDQVSICPSVMTEKLLIEEAEQRLRQTA
jgi:hypothetical protein